LVSRVTAILTLRPDGFGLVESKMRARELKQLMAQTAKLTLTQREQLMAQLGGAIARDEVMAIIHSRPAGCRRCQSVRVVRNGQAGGLQRYKCRSCGTTFNALTGSPLAGLRHRDKWLLQAEALDEGLSVRKAAARLDVHRTTAFRWRHRFLALPREIKAQQLAGVAEADETYLLCSYKGQPSRLRAEQTRKPRRRGGRATKPGLSAEQVPILVVRNRAGQTTDFVLEAANKRCVSAVLKVAVADDAVLCTDGSNMLATVARELDIEHHAINILRGERTRGAWHIQNVNAYHGRLKGWMRRFKGISTFYLPNYLGWFRALDRNAQTGAKPAALLALAIAA
jgi:transposase-like protein